MSFKLADVKQIYNEDPKLQKKDVEAVFEWLKTQTHLPELTELQVIVFLYGSSYEIEATKATIEKYFTFKTTSELAECPTEEVIKRTLSAAFITVLPKRTPDGNAILLTKQLDLRPQNYNYVEQAIVALMACYVHYHQYGPANGMVAVFDVGGMGLGHLFKINFSAAKQIVYFVQEAAPSKVKGIHHVNTVSIVEHLVGLLKPFMKKELYNLMKFHSGSYDALYDVVPKKCLPSDYGGELPSIQEMQEENLKNLIDSLDFYKWHNTQKIKQSTTSRNASEDTKDNTSIENSVQKLEID